MKEQLDKIRNNITALQKSQNSLESSISGGHEEQATKIGENERRIGLTQKKIDLATQELKD
jgi:hypothetical protein